MPVIITDLSDDGGTALPIDLPILGGKPKSTLKPPPRGFTDFSRIRLSSTAQHWSDTRRKHCEGITGFVYTFCSL